ncbi:MAG TPA: S1 RNA-binding domain-containing protein, partial [Ardenticatenaceae bacterium]|nr:S1 RNA-binding domain-containing protein [Ardenticatenaceae bacterium]
MSEFVGEREDKETSLMWQYLENEAYDYQRAERGDILSGIVLRIDPNEIVVDVNLKREAIIPARDLEKLDVEEVENLKEGDEVSVYVLQPEDNEGRLVVSLNMAKTQEDWERAEQMMTSGEIFESKVSGYNKGGIIVPFGRLRAFSPASQIASLPPGDEANRIDRLQRLVGKPLKFKVIEVNERRRRLIVSERSAMREWRKEAKERLLAELRPGDVRTGTVTNLMNFGAFVDLGGADGLIHVSELSWQRVKHPRDVLEVGQEVEVSVLSVDPEHERIALSMKRLQKDPWTEVVEQYNVGDVVRAEVTNLTEFGAFARIADGVEGLIHVSELADHVVAHPREVVHRGQVLPLKIISIDGDRQRIGL